MGNFPIATALQTGGNILTTALNFHFQKKMNEQNWQRQREFIDDERAYNDPKEQMKRLEEAGINTTFAGLNSNVSTGSEAGGQTPLQGVAPQIGNPLDGLATSLQAESSAHLSNAETERYKALTPQLVEKAKAETAEAFSNAKKAEALAKIHLDERVVSAMNRAMKTAIFNILFDDKGAWLPYDTEYWSDELNVSSLAPLQSFVNDWRNGKLSKGDMQAFNQILDGVLDDWTSVISGETSLTQQGVNRALVQLYKTEADLMPKDNKYRPNSTAQILTVVLAMLAKYGFKEGLDEIINRFASDYGDGNAVGDALEAKSSNMKQD